MPTANITANVSRCRGSFTANVYAGGTKKKSNIATDRAAASTAAPRLNLTATSMIASR
ncbi:MAG: hypothetical protein IPM79_31850 [Polyangiaceae bacterium]|nr:hypothetical protein [Polyangiaceae bacterium]